MPSPIPGQIYETNHNIDTSEITIHNQNQSNKKRTNHVSIRLESFPQSISLTKHNSRITANLTEIPLVYRYSIVV